MCGGEETNVKRNRWLILPLLVLAALLLSGCGVALEGVDVTEVPPDGWWQTLVVWPLAKALIWLNNVLAGLNIPYSWGFAIILFTLIIKLVTLPLTITQIRGMQAQREIQPKIQELQKKYGKDREKLSQEQMRLYREAGVNPLSGCLPLLVQMPILFGLYAALVALGPNLADARFFWIPDLGFPQYTKGLSWIGEAFGRGDFYTLIAYLILPILLVVTQFIMQKWMTPATPDGGQAANMTKQIGLMMTFMFGFFTLQVPAGLSLYWVTSNLLQMLQQWLITDARFGLAPAAAPAGSGTQLDAAPAAGTSGSAPVPAVAGEKPAPAADKSRTPKRRRAKRR